MGVYGEPLSPNHKLRRNSIVDKLDGLTMDIEAANRDKLRAVFPECFAEGRLDIDKLLSLCGEYVSDDFEKYECPAAFKVSSVCPA